MEELHNIINIFIDITVYHMENGLAEGIIGRGRLETTAKNSRDNGGLKKNGSSKDEKKWND